MAKFLISLPQELSDKVNAYCAKNFFERSEFVRSLLRDKLESHKRELLGDAGFTKATIPTVDVLMNNTPEDTPITKAFEETKKIAEKKELKLCKHFQMWGLCKHGCK